MVTAADVTRCVQYVVEHRRRLARAGFFKATRQQGLAGGGDNSDARAGVNRWSGYAF